MTDFKTSYVRFLKKLAKPKRLTTYKTTTLPPPVFSLAQNEPAHHFRVEHFTWVRGGFYERHVEDILLLRDFANDDSTLNAQHGAIVDRFVLEVVNPSERGYADEAAARVFHRFESPVAVTVSRAERLKSLVGRTWATVPGPSVANGHFDAEIRARFVTGDPAKLAADVDNFATFFPLSVQQPKDPNKLEKLSQDEVREAYGPHGGPHVISNTVRGQNLFDPFLIRQMLYLGPTEASLQEREHTGNLRIIGRASETGSSGHNRTLSKARAESVRTRIADLHLTKEFFLSHVSALGEDQLIAPDAQGVAEQGVDRSVEIRYKRSSLYVQVDPQSVQSDSHKAQMEVCEQAMQRWETKLSKAIAAGEDNDIPTAVPANNHDDYSSVLGTDPDPARHYPAFEMVRKYQRRLDVKYQSGLGALHFALHAPIDELLNAEKVFITTELEGLFKFGDHFSVSDPSKLSDGNKTAWLPIAVIFALGQPGGEGKKRMHCLPRSFKEKVRLQAEGFVKWKEQYLENFPVGSTLAGIFGGAPGVEEWIDQREVRKRVKQRHGFIDSIGLAASLHMAKLEKDAFEKTVERSEHQRKVWTELPKWNDTPYKRYEIVGKETMHYGFDPAEIPTPSGHFWFAEDMKEALIENKTEFYRTVLKVWAMLYQNRVHAITIIDKPNLNDACVNLLAALKLDEEINHDRVTITTACGSIYCWQWAT